MVFSISIAACLGLHSVPDSGWHCLNCNDNTGNGRGARPIMVRLTRVDKAPDYEMGGCVVCRLVIWLFIIYIYVCVCVTLIFLNNKKWKNLYQK